MTASSSGVGRPEPGAQVSSVGGIARAAPGRLIDRICEALGDPRRSRRTALSLIAVYALVWWGYACVAKGTQGIHFDMGEVFAWSQHPAFGYSKHPPFPGWVDAVWFAVFPCSDWAYYLLSATSIGVALWFVFLITERFVEGGDKRLVALLFFFFAPIFNFQPLKFNSNALLIPVWAAAAWLFLRSFERRTLWWGALAGLGAAIAMLTKYWSFFLIAGFGVAALADPRRTNYFRSAAPWASVAAGAALFAPHIKSMIIDYDYGPFRYATGAHSVATYVDSIDTVAGYLSGVLYLAGSFLVLALAVRPDAAAWRDMLWPRQPERRFLLIVTLTSLLLPAAFALALKMEVKALWTMPCWAMLPAMLLSSPRVAVTRQAAGAVLIGGYAAAVLAFAASPLVAMVILQRGVPNSAIYYPLLADEAGRLWRSRSDQPLRYVAGPIYLAWACSFYCRGHPLALGGFSFEQAPWIARADMLRDGFVGLCESANRDCASQVQALASDAAVETRTVELTRHAFGVAAEPERFTLFVLAPCRPADRAQRRCVE
jgi:4-amino-4-deoxy-L-arabinose transferase-like glycosyltransferase